MFIDTKKPRELFFCTYSSSLWPLQDHMFQIAMTTRTIKNTDSKKIKKLEQRFFEFWSKLKSGQNRTCRTDTRIFDTNC